MTLMTMNDDIMILWKSDLSFDDVEEWFNVDTFATCTLLLTAKWTIVSAYPQVEQYCVSRHSDLYHCPSLFDLSLMSMLFRVVQVFSCFRRIRCMICYTFSSRPMVQRSCVMSFAQCDSIPFFQESFRDALMILWQCHDKYSNHRADRRRDVNLQYDWSDIWRFIKKTDYLTK